MIESQTRDQYEDNLYWWRKYSDMADELSEAYLVIGKQKKEIERLKAELWQAKNRRK